MALKTRIKKEQIEALGTASKILTSTSGNLLEAHANSLASSTIASITLGTAAASKVLTADSSTELSGLGLLAVPKLEASTDLDIGPHDFRAATLTADGLTDGRVVYAGASGVLSSEAGFEYDASANSLSAPATQIGNIRTTSNTISSTDTDGNIIISPNGNGSVSVGSSKILGVLAPALGTDAANKDYVDSVAQGLSAKDSVRVATDNAISGYAFSGGVFTESSASGALTLDSIVLADGDRVLVRSQAGNGDFSAHLQNGIYVVGNVDGSSAVTLTRSADLDSQVEAQAGAYFFVEEGSNADAGFVLTTDGAITINTTALAFTQFSGAGQISADVGLSKVGNDINLNFNSNLSDEAWGAGDKLAFMDAGDNGMHRQTIDALATKFAGAGMAASSAVIAVVNATNGGLDVQAGDVKLDVGNLSPNGAVFVGSTDFIAIHDQSSTSTKKITGANFLNGCIDAGQMEVASNVIKISDSALGMTVMGHISLQGREILLTDQASNTEIVSGDHSDYGGLANVTFDSAHNASSMNAVYLNGMRLTNKAGAAGDYVFAADGSGKVKIVFQSGVLEDGDLLSWCIYGV